MKISKKSKQLGMTLTETLLVLGVGAAVAVIAYGGYKMATSQVNASSQTRGAIQLIGGIKRIFGLGTNYSTVTAANVINAQVVPDDFKIDTGTSTIYSGFGGTVVPAVGDQAGVTPITQYKITFNGVPKSACNDFVGGLSGAAVHSLWVGGTTAGTHDVKPAGAAYLPDRAATQCAAADTNTVVAVVQ